MRAFDPMQKSETVMDRGERIETARPEEKPIGTTRRAEQPLGTACQKATHDVLASHRAEKRRGFFIALEGTDGSGKTTVLDGVKARFAAAGLDVLYTREPGGPPISEQIRALLLDPNNEAMAPMTEALLYAASRAQHVQEVLRPALAAGHIVLSDRYVLSSIAYQGAGRGLGMGTVAAINSYAISGLLPDLTLFLDVDPKEVLRRKARRVAADRLEQAGDAFFENVYNGYQQVLEKTPGAVRIDATRPAEEVIQDAWETIEESLKAWRSETA